MWGEILIADLLKYIKDRFRELNEKSIRNEIIRQEELKFYKKSFDCVEYVKYNFLPVASLNSGSSYTEEWVKIPQIDEKDTFVIKNGARCEKNILNYLEKRCFETLANEGNKEECNLGSKKILHLQDLIEKLDKNKRNSGFGYGCHLRDIRIALSFRWYFDLIKDGHIELDKDGNSFCLKTIPVYPGATLDDIDVMVFEGGHLANPFEILNVEDNFVTFRTNFRLLVPELCLVVKFD